MTLEFITWWGESVRQMLSLQAYSQSTQEQSRHAKADTYMVLHMLHTDPAHHVFWLCTWKVDSLYCKLCRLQHCSIK